MSRQIIKSNETRFTIYVWKRQVLASSKNRRIGHVSARTWTGGPDGEGYHISFWPLITAKIFSRYGVPSYMASSLGEDIDYEKADPTHIFELYSLDIPKINTLWEKYCNKNLGIRWATLASTFFMHPETINCVEIVRRLLIAGGIKNLETHGNIAYVAAGTALSLLGISAAGSCVLPVNNAPFFVPQSWSSSIDRFKLGMGLGIGLTLVGVTITHKSKTRAEKYITHAANTVAMGTACFTLVGSIFLKLMNAMISGIISIKELCGKRNEQDDFMLKVIENFERTAASDAFTVCLLFGGLAAIIASTTIGAFKLLDKAFITPDDMFKIVSVAEDCEKIRYELLEEERCGQTHSFDRVTLGR